MEAWLPLFLKQPKNNLHTYIVYLFYNNEQRTLVEDVKLKCINLYNYDATTVYFHFCKTAAIHHINQQRMFVKQDLLWHHHRCI